VHNVLLLPGNLSRKSHYIELGRAGAKAQPSKGSNMLIETYDLEIEVSKHSAEEFEYEAIARLPVDIAPVLPYLNATLKSGFYLPDGPAFSWRKDDHKIGIWPDRIGIDHLETREQASEKMVELVKLINDVWEKRAEIEPDNTMHENLQPLELFRLLPKTNCKECGESSCFNFALKLAAGQTELEKCKPLYAEDQYKDQRTELESLVATKRPLL
jgi:ArsR family metal-binding transcriptional regulator